MGDWQSYLKEEKDRFVEELMEFLRIPSISSLKAHRPDVEKAAQWVEARMKKAGIESVKIMPTGGHPVVYGDWLHAPGKPTILIYGHFDTQPVDPLDLWDTPPFNPVVRDDRIYARGATDDKGNLFIPITAVEAVLKTEGKLPVNLKFMFEGQEEIGSPQLPEFLSANQDRFSADMVLSADGGQWDEDQPVIVLGTRGLAAVFVDVRGPEYDLHSGTYGGTIANPIHALATIIESMHDKDGRVTVDGFYDDVRDLADEERKQFARIPFEEKEYLDEIGAVGLYGESGFSTYERGWARPTLEINGIYGGFQGEGIKTVLPSTAHAKISCRLVADQDASKIAERVISHIHSAAPPGVKLTAVESKSGAEPYLVPEDHPGVRIAASVLTEVYGREPYRARLGGTIPANALFLSTLKAHTIVFSFGLQDERQHSPNEFFRLSSFDRGQTAYGMLLNRLGEEFK
jgi:acetylornithine deacetylase/succinyl-diaminopimelate desuccinylase-like protein